MGVFDNTVYRTQRLRLQPHDTILAYTDGVTEAVDVHQGLYSNQRLITTVQGAPANSAEELVQTVMGSSDQLHQGSPPAESHHRPGPVALKAKRAVGKSPTKEGE